MFKTDGLFAALILILMTIPQVIYMLILIMLLFFICWAPILIFNMLAAFGMLGYEEFHDNGNKRGYENNFAGTSPYTKTYKTIFSFLSYINRSAVRNEY